MIAGHNVKYFALLAFATGTLAACQTAQPRFSVQSRKPVIIANYKFDKSISTDFYGSDLKLLEIKPKALPYSGKIAALSAQERWLKMFKAALILIKADCKGKPAKMPEIISAELDYKKFGNSPQHPTYIQAKYICDKNDK